MLTILLATYNGEKYLAAQLDSLFAQSDQDFSLYICDDASTDSTLEILVEYAEKYPGQITLQQRNTNSGDAKYNFFKMMMELQDDYIMLCDQDDVWLPTKIEQTKKKMKELEYLYGVKKPLLVHTDLKVVKSDLTELHPSFKHMVGTPEISTLKGLVLQNNVTGCTVMYNRALAKLLTKEPSFFVMHDWWLAMIAMAFGHTGYLDETTVLYRQHSKNSIGAQDVHSLAHKLYKLTHITQTRTALFDSYRQAGAFLDLFSEKLEQQDKELLIACASLPQKGKLARLSTMHYHNLFRHGFLRKVSQIMFG